MKKIKIGLIFLIVSSLSHGQTPNDSDTDFFNTLKSKNLEIKTMNSDFKQTKYVVLLDGKTISNGQFYYTKPDKMIMEFTQPKGDYMLINENQFVMFVSGKRHETTSKANAKMRGFKAILTASLEGDFDNIGATKITYSSSSKYHIATIEMDTKLNKSGTEKVVVSYDKQDYSLSVIQTIEPDGSYTIYEFTNKSFNQAITDDTYDG